MPRMPIASLAVVAAGFALSGESLAARPPVPTATMPTIAGTDPPLAVAFDSRGEAAPRPMLLAGRAGAPVTSPSAEVPADIALRFARERLQPAGDLGLAHVRDGSARFVTFQQAFGGVPVHLGRITVAVLPDGSVLAAHAGELAPGPPLPLSPRARVTTAEQAFAAARAALGRAADAPLGPAPFAEPVLFATATGCERAFRVQVMDLGRADRYVQMILHAETGALLRLDPLVFPGVARARVVPRDPPSGLAWVDFVDPVTNPSVDSPAGWTVATETIGNNVHAQLDREADFFPPYGAVAQATGDPPALDFAFTGTPSADAGLALTNVFWAVNDAHDRFRRLGFDEASGACQTDNFGRGGVRADDRVWALVQYASVDGTRPYNGVGMGVGADGTFTYLVTGVFEDASGQLKDGALETDLLYHELAHQVSTRLVGNDAACMTGAQPQALSEGWSDFFAASFTEDPVIGAWTAGTPNGHRTGPIGATGYSLVNLCEGGACNRFTDGEIWAGTLWDLRARFIQMHGAADGVARAERLIVEGMRFTPCQPTFLEARDGILLADAALTGGAHRCELWQVFVNRGMGASATTTGPADMRPIAGYDMPPECSGSANVFLDQDTYAPDDDGLVEVVDARAPAGATVTLSTSGGDALTLPLTRVPGGALLRAPFTIVPGPANPGDAVLQAADGETVTATYGARSDQASVTAAMDIRVLQHFVHGNWCQMSADDDDVPGWYVLPKFLDAGEEATIAVTLGNATGADLENLQMTVTSLSPTVRVLPSSPIPLGSVGPQPRTGPRRFEAQFKATARPTATAGEMATLRFDFRSRGRTGSAQLTLELNMDYVLETALSPFSGGTETFDPATSPTAGSWSTVTRRGAINLWRTEACAGATTPHGWHVGEPGCAPYGDGQVATTLESPSLFALPAASVAMRLRDWSFAINSDLWTDPGNPLCDADFVGLFTTTDPATFDYATGERIYRGDAWRYWRPLYEDTGGWRVQQPFSYSREPFLLVPGADYSALRMMWVFWGDVYDCGFETPNRGQFLVDDVRFTYEIVRKVPEAQACGADCVVIAPLAADPPGGKCPGEVFTLRAQGWEQIACGGPVYFSFAGPGVPAAAGWTTTPETNAVGEDGGIYSLYTQCETQPDCHDYRALQNISPAPPGIGTVLPGTLRARRSAADVTFAWMGAAAPPSYGLWQTTSAGVATPLSSWTLVARQDAREGPRGENEVSVPVASLPGSLLFFRAAGRDRCTDTPRG